MGPRWVLQREKNATVRCVPNQALFPLKFLPHIGPQKTFRRPIEELLASIKQVWRLTQSA